MRFSRGEVVFHRLKIRTKATNVAEIDRLEVRPLPPLKKHIVTSFHSFSYILPAVPCLCNLTKTATNT
ncbi:hypothetical protein E2C01_071196 [Portunus trituberculatus]|uniref:Uncharacterized protein n=1 Tax=Portunus trituberculatus TaxID=210409 RepID=A0A5B7I3S0_PORTR|nr:hypothetical protein [Portunus trituberculatus]